MFFEGGNLQLAQEEELAYLLESCNKKYTSPTELADARHNISSFILRLLPGDPRVAHMERMAICNGVFGPDELSVLRKLGVPLPKTFGPSTKGIDMKKFIPSDYHLNRFVRDVTWGQDPWEEPKRLGVVFMVADMINAGHLAALAEAKKSGECNSLLLMLTSDLLAGAMKSAPGDFRPKMSFAQRMFMASQIEAVDGVYAVPVVRRNLMPFEMVLLARVHQKLGIPFDDLGDRRIEPLDLEVIRNLIKRPRKKDWDFYVTAYLGLTYNRSSRLDECEGFYSPNFSHDAQIAYRSLLVDWWNAFDLSEDRFTFFISDYDPKMADLHLQQIRRFWRSSRVVRLSSACPQTSSSYIFHNYPLRSEAQEEAVEILDLLRSWGWNCSHRYFNLQRV